MLQIKGVEIILETLFTQTFRTKDIVYFIKHLKRIAFIGFTASGMDVPQFVSSFQLMKDEMYTTEIQKINLKKTPFFPQKKYIPMSFKIFCINFGVSSFFQILSKSLLS